MSLGFSFTVTLQVYFVLPTFAVIVAFPLAIPLIFTECFLEFTETIFATFLFDVIQENFFETFFNVNVKELPTNSDFLVLLSFGEAALTEKEENTVNIVAKATANEIIGLLFFIV